MKKLHTIILSAIILLFFQSSFGQTVTDIDGNVYDVVSIGNQCWLSENLKTSHYRNGDPIISGLSDSEWSSTNIGAYSFYNNDTSYNYQYGNLDNWFNRSE